MEVQFQPGSEVSYLQCVESLGSSESRPALPLEHGHDPKGRLQAPVSSDRCLRAVTGDHYCTSPTEGLGW